MPRDLPRLLPELGFVLAAPKLAGHRDEPLGLGLAV
jgi:hypothetical protein